MLHSKRKLKYKIEPKTKQNTIYFSPNGSHGKSKLDLNLGEKGYKRAFLSEKNYQRHKKGKIYIQFVLSLHFCLAFRSEH